MAIAPEGRRAEGALPDPTFVHPEIVAPETRSMKAFRYVAAALRLSLGWVFLWAFLDKAFALGFRTGRDAETGVVDYFGDAAWINGGSPTEGFLSFGTKGPFAEFFASFAGAAWADWLFMLGLAGIGIAFVAGVAMRIAAASGALLLVLMYLAAPPMALPVGPNPFMDDHIVYAIAMVALALVGAGHTLGLGKVWDRLPVVRDHGFLE